MKVHRNIHQTIVHSSSVRHAVSHSQTQTQWIVCHRRCSTQTKQYKHRNFRESIMQADGVDVIQQTLGTIKRITSQKQQAVHASLYSAAIQRAQELNEYKECWRLYNEAKHAQVADIYLVTQMITITAQFIHTQFMFDYEHKNARTYNQSKMAMAKHKMLKRVHQLYSEMKYELRLQPTHATYAALIHACSSFNSFIAADTYWQRYCEDEAHSQRRHIDVYAAIIFSKIHKTDIAGALQLFNDMVHEHGIQPNAYIISKVLAGLSRHILKRKQNKSKFMEISELIEQSETILKTYVAQRQKEDRKYTIEIDVYNAICNVYAANGDVTSCFDILHCLMDGKLPNAGAATHIPAATPGVSTKVGTPSPDTVTFNSCLKSLANCNEWRCSDNQHNIWRLAEFVLQKMTELKIEKTCATYATLFNLCGNASDAEMEPELDKAIAYYTQLSNTALMISRKCMFSLLLTGLQYYDYHALHNNEKQQNKLEFIEWWLSEAKDYRVQCSLSMQQLLDIKAKNFRLPK